MRNAFLFALISLMLAGCSVWPSDIPLPAGSVSDPGQEAPEPETDETPAVEPIQSVEPEAVPPSLDSGSVIAQLETSVTAYSWATGKLTYTLRSVSAGDKTLTVRYAIRWDSDVKDDNGDEITEAMLIQLGIRGDTSAIIDNDQLKLYRPFCREGSWAGAGAKVGSDEYEAYRACIHSTLSTFNRSNERDVLANHQTMEGYAVFPAPEGRPEKVDVLINDSSPAFVDVPVTYE
ncbi:MAG: hypothetical protein LBR21_07595 [Propionibacteriaceae bacterium]|jgi:hypothetical protein|nr:hypothetical protein [Propionibacteriaceae bacterium]